MQIVNHPETETHEQSWAIHYDRLPWERFRDITDWMAKNLSSFNISSHEGIGPTGKGHVNASKVVIWIHEAGDLMLFKAKWEGAK
jgi:hypothetical protein